MKITEYQLVEAYSVSDVEERVTRLLAQNWVPVGGVTFVPGYRTNGGAVLLQAMVRSKE